MSTLKTWTHALVLISTRLYHPNNGPWTHSYQQEPLVALPYVRQLLVFTIIWLTFLTQNQGHKSFYQAIMSPLSDHRFCSTPLVQNPNWHMTYIDLKANTIIYLICSCSSTYDMPFHTAYSTQIEKIRSFVEKNFVKSLETTNLKYYSSLSFNF